MADRGRGEGDLDVRGPRQRRHVYGVVVLTLTRPERSRIGQENSVESLWISLFPSASADRARAAVSAR
ncbi:hypothetical protein AB3X52_12580 [Nocardioides sp. DS6]|uniref:Uncharacterized protein n=1 Tax=Nocardioides eburneus TaxID=3231482 RepID=A0ABV3T3L6_9ACTN